MTNEHSGVTPDHLDFDVALFDEHQEGASLQPAELTPEQLLYIDRFYDLVKPVAFKLFRSPSEAPEEFEEALGDGYLGLVLAARNFDTAKQGDETTTGTQFAWRSIRGAMLHGMRSRRGREQSTKEERENGIRKDNVSTVKPGVINGTATSFSAPIHNGEIEGCVGDTVADSRVEHAAENALALSEIMSNLEIFHPRDRKIYFLHQFVGLKQQEIADEFGLSQMQVSRIIRRINKCLAGSQSEAA